MNTHFPLLLSLFMIPAVSISLHAQPLLQRLATDHGPFWTEAFGMNDWRGADVGFVVVKHTNMLHVVRQGRRRDTIVSFPVCAMNTSPGFKVREGDARTPDGIYRIPLLNPGSSYHLSMKMDYPNAVDNARHARHTRLAGRRWSQGGDIFIHGKCASVGCLAMTDEVIEKLYLLVASLPASRREIPVLVLPYDSEAHYQQLFFHADSEYAETRDPYWLLLREHVDNMRAVWRRYLYTGRIPDAAPTRDGRYALPDDTR